jgi:hypothetical protein
LQPAVLDGLQYLTGIVPVMIYGLFTSSGLLIGTSFDIMHNHGAWIGAFARGMVIILRTTGVA